MYISIPLYGTRQIKLSAELSIPTDSKGLIIFAHGSGSGKSSPRNQQAVKVLNNNGFATLLADLLTPEEQERDLKNQNLNKKDRNIILNKFDIELLSNRLEHITKWVINNISETAHLPIGYFGSSTGAAAALVSAVKWPDKLKAIVCRGGRVDLAYKYCNIKEFRTPLLLVVGEKDPFVIEVNEKLLTDLKNVDSDHKKLIIIPGATHLFEEEGKIEQVARLSASWFKKFII